MPKAVSQSAQRELNTTTAKFVTFVLNDETYAVNASRVNEVLRYTEITPVPGAPNFVLGIINLRGDVLTVIDTREVFGLIPQEVTSQSRIVVVELEDFAVGVLVDRVAAVIDLQESKIEPPPHTGSDNAARFIQGVYHYEEELLVLVNFTRMSTL